MTFNADNQLHGIQERGAELSQDAPCQLVRLLDLAMRSNYKVNANSRSLDDARLPHCVATSSSSPESLPRMCRSASLPRNPHHLPLQPRSATSVPHIPPQPSQRSSSMPPLQATQSSSEEYSITTSATGAGSGYKDVKTTQSIMASNTNFDQNVLRTIAPRAYILYRTVTSISIADFRRSVDARRIHVEGSIPTANDELVSSDL